MLNLISSVLQQECKQESENLDKGRITGSAPSPSWKKLPLPLNGGRSHAFSFLDLGRSAFGGLSFFVGRGEVSHRGVVEIRRPWWNRRRPVIMRCAVWWLAQFGMSGEAAVARERLAADVQLGAVCERSCGSAACRTGWTRCSFSPEWMRRCAARLFDAEKRACRPNTAKYLNLAKIAK